MKKMIKMAMMAAAMFAVVTTTAQAQGGGGGGGRGGRVNPLVVLKDSMHVSDAILAKADSIVKAAAAESAPLFSTCSIMSSLPFNDSFPLRSEERGAHRRVAGASPGGSPDREASPAAVGS